MIRPLDAAGQYTIYPLTLLVPAGLSPAIEAMPLLGNLFISRFLIAGIIVWLMV